MGFPEEPESYYGSQYARGGTGPAQFRAIAQIAYAVTTPVYVTAIPRGPVTLEISTGCLFFSCFGQNASTKFTMHDNPLVAVHSVDSQIAMYWFNTYSARKIRINGWTRNAWIEEFGSLSSIPHSARPLERDPEASGTEQVDSNLTVRDANQIVVVQSDGEIAVRRVANPI